MQCQYWLVLPNLFTASCQRCKLNGWIHNLYTTTTIWFLHSMYPSLLKCLPGAGSVCITLLVPWAVLPINFCIQSFFCGHKPVLQSNLSINTYIIYLYYFISNFWSMKEPSIHKVDIQEVPVIYTVLEKDFIRGKVMLCDIDRFSYSYWDRKFLLFTKHLLFIDFNRCRQSNLIYFSIVYIISLFFRNRHTGSAV